MSLQSPVKKIYITQKFGANPAAYKRFGLNGHNGIDFRAFLPNGNRCYSGGQSPVYAPHNGTIVENIYDRSGYGNYVKIENSKEGSVLAHFSSKCELPEGTKVKMGDFIAYQGTTGNSSGIHLHWGYYQKPRNRKNGFNGYIDQEKLFNPYGQSANQNENQQNLEQKSNKESEKMKKQLEEFLKRINWSKQSEDLSANDWENLINFINQLKTDKVGLTNDKEDLQKDIKNLQEQIVSKDDDIKKLVDRNEALLKEHEIYKQTSQKEALENKNDIEFYKKENKQLQEKILELKKQLAEKTICPEQKPLWQLIVERFQELFK